MSIRLSRRAVTAGVAAATVLAPSVARADGVVDLQLVMAVDASGSVSTERFNLQKRGYADAFRSRDVRDAIRTGRTQAIAVIMTQWTGPLLTHVAVSWRRVGDPGSLMELADSIDASPRRLFAGGTSISGAVDHGMKMLGECPFAGPGGRIPRRVIDVSGDGPNNRGRKPEQARDDAAAADVTINGLPILVLEPDLDAYYRDHVIGGTGAFVIAAETYDDFGAAVRRKLVQEISAMDQGRRLG